MRLDRWLALISAVSCLPSVRANDAGAQKDLEAWSAQMKRAYFARDAGAFANLLSPDFTVMGLHGKISHRSEYVRGTMTDSANFGSSIKSWTRTIQNFKLHHDTAVATVHYRIQGRPKDQNGNSFPVINSGTSQDTWVRTSAGWKLRRVIVLSNLLLVNGKPYLKPLRLTR